jgi:hypothetical protein
VAFCFAERDSLARMGAIEVRETAGFLASKCPGYFHQPQTSASVTPIGGPEWPIRVMRAGWARMSGF